MRTRDVSHFLSAAFAARLPVLLKGAPGVGKTDLVAQAAKAAGARLIVSHPVVADPTDAKGLPWPDADKGRATFLPCGEIADLIAAQEPTVWFLDDLGQAPAAVQAGFMQWLLARRLNGHVLPDCVTICAATNRRQDRAGVQGILEPVKSRFAAIIDVEPNIDDWSTWALGANMPAEIVAFLRFRPELLSADKPAAEIVNSPSPRTWANLARLMALGLPQRLEIEAFAGAVGQGAAVEFTAFLRTFRGLVTVDQILIDPQAAPLPEEPAELYAIATGLATRATVRSFGPIAVYLTRLDESGKGEFCSLCLRDCFRKCSAIQGTPEFLKIATGPLGRLILGQEDPE